MILRKHLLLAFFLLGGFNPAEAEEPVKIIAGPMFTMPGDNGDVAIWFQTNRSAQVGLVIKSITNDSRGGYKGSTEETWEDQASADAARNIFIHKWPSASEEYNRVEITIRHGNGVGSRDLFKGEIPVQPCASKHGQYTIAFGSCSHQERFDEHQPIWDAVVKQKPDCFLFIGDNIYLPNRLSEYPTKREDVLKLYCDTYDRQRRIPEMQPLLRSTMSFALWDDHEIEERRVGKECRSRWSPYH